MHEDFRLPEAAQPTRYKLRLTPDLEAGAFEGRVEIALNVREPVDRIVLNAAKLEIAEAKIGGGAAKVELLPEKERAAFTLENPVPAGEAKLEIAFRGRMDHGMRGFYLSRYKAEDGPLKPLASTQFEAASARLCFPCFDEPDRKAVFEVEMDAPAGLDAVSNTDPVKTDSVGGGRRRFTFAPTPKMSTYLLAFAVGEFERIEARTKDGVAVRILTPPGRAELGHFSLESAVRGLEYYDAYYGIPYKEALPKLDQLAIPDFEAGAMENWGMVTYREIALFVDPKRSSVPARRRVAEAVLHELAHQWFGNLVTMKWWSELWLNESFATFMAAKATDALFPDWKLGSLGSNLKIQENTRDSIGLRLNIRIIDDSTRDSFCGERSKLQALENPPQRVTNAG